MCHATPRFEGAQFVELLRKSVLHRGVEVRGDLASIKVGRYCDALSVILDFVDVNPMKLWGQTITSTSLGAV